MTLPSITAAGNLTADPELKFTHSGVARCSFTVACGERKQVDGKWVDGDTTFLRVVCWRQLAENAAESLSKGSGVTITGRLRQRKYEKDGETKQIEEVDAWTIAVDLGRQVASPRRVTRDASQAHASIDDDPWAVPMGEPAPF